MNVSTGKFTTENLSILSSKLRELIEREKASGVNQKELAALIGIAESTLSQYKTGKRAEISLKELVQIADHFGISIDSLLGRKTASGSSILRDAAPEHLIDDLAAEFENLREQVATTSRALERLKKSRGKVSVSSDAKRFVEKADEKESGA